MLFDWYEWPTWCNQHNSGNQTYYQISSLSVLIPVSFHTHTSCSLLLASLGFSYAHNFLMSILQLTSTSPPQMMPTLPWNIQAMKTTPPFTLFHQPLLQPENKLLLGRRLIGVQPFSPCKTAYLIKNRICTMLHQEPKDTHAGRSGWGRDLSEFSSVSWRVPLQNRMK